MMRASSTTLASSEYQYEGQELFEIMSRNDSKIDQVINILKKALTNLNEGMEKVIVLLNEMRDIKPPDPSIMIETSLRHHQNRALENVEGDGNMRSNQASQNSARLSYSDPSSEQPKNYKQSNAGIHHKRNPTEPVADRRNLQEIQGGIVPRITQPISNSIPPYNLYAPVQFTMPFSMPPRITFNSIPYKAQRRWPL